KSPKLIEKTLKPDIKNKKDIKVQIKTEKNNLIIKINTQKISYLKAVVNSYLSLIKMLKEMEE
ncbi:MAG: CTAG/PCC1 family protein, partial [Candidatus Aenigmarchaeota archaeon]|nr:CTAG/PCC1 family protein [Candidatus Aenigmarchaeota archaeon]